MMFGEYIRKLRDERDLSLREFARKLDCSAPFISDVELGRRYPSEELLKQIAKLLGKAVEDLRKYDQRPPATEDIKKLISTDPAYALAFRQILEKRVPAQDLLKLAKRTHPAKKDDT